MIKSYKNFLDSNILENLLLEAYLEISDKFKDRLILISGKSPIANFILSKNDDYIEDDKISYNFLDTTDKDDMVGFLSQKKFDKGIIGDVWDNKDRSSIKVGRLVKSLVDSIGGEFTTQDIEKFVNLYKSTNNQSLENMKLVKGEDIRKWYLEDNHLEDYGKGSLSNSCMRNEDCQNYFDIYVENKNCSLLILTRQTEDGVFLIGRALVWKLDSNINNYEYFMDRIYTLRDSDEEKFSEYALKNNYLCKWLNKSGNTGFDYKGSKVNKYRISVSIQNGYDEYPYMDTLLFINSDGTEISNVGYVNGCVLDSTSGEIDPCDDCSGDGLRECYDCSGSGKVTCDDCNSGKVTCDICDGDRVDSNGDECKECGGSGRLDCSECGGSGNEECGNCDGIGEYKCGSCVGILES